MRFDLDDCYIYELEEFGLPMHILTHLENHGITKLKTLLRCHPEDIRQLRNLGEGTVTQILAAVRAHKDRHGW